MSTSDHSHKRKKRQSSSQSKSPIKPLVAIVLGFRARRFADEMTDAVRISYSHIPHFVRFHSSWDMPGNWCWKHRRLASGDHAGPVPTL